MTSQMKHTLAIIGSVAVILLLILGGYSLHRASVEDAADRATLKAKMEAANSQIVDLMKSIKDRDAKADADKKNVDTDVKNAKTPDQQAALIALLSGMNKPPVTMIVPTPQVPGAAPAKELPNDPVATVSRQQLTDWTTFAGSCKKCEIDLATATGDLATKDGIIKKKDGEISDLKVANKGGTKVQRMKRAGKWMLVGGVTAEALRILLKGKF